MFSRKFKLPLFAMIVVPASLIILAALGLSGAAVIENLRFIGAESQILDLLSKVRTVANGQKGFATNAGEDIWDAMERAGQTFPTHYNPWQGEIRAVTVPNSGMRIETDLPTRDCRRLALYFLGRQPGEVGLLSIQAEPYPAESWGQIYPIAAAHKNDSVVESACGRATYARIALVFRLR
jgi:hypothetical protein